MAGGVSEEAGVGKSLDSSGQCCQFGEALAEWRSSEQVENGTPSTSPPYWDSDDDDDGGPKPSQLHGRNTWKIEKFSQTNKRELRSDVFEVGGYKWYILIYPQGCDVCNHLSLFLCVANHDKLLPGWSHFAQFTIAVVNKDPKKSKYSDTLHRFWKKEHDWGWKKFMELSKVSDGFLDASDTLIIKAQVQVIREKADRPFRCLDCQYRRELVRVYLTNVEQICRRFVEERRGKLGKLIENKNKWSSFCAFWLGKDHNTRRDMSREKMDAILKLVVKHFFIEKEVTSTLVMDSLYSGLKALEGQSKSKKGRVRLGDAEEMPAPIIHVEKDMFVLGDDVLILLERAAMEPLPPKDEKGPQNRMKDGNSGEDFNKDSIERDERRLTELGRRTVEIFVLAHIFNHKIEVAYDEAVAFKMQEELIREEHEQKAKRGASEKEKKSKKKQSKQRRNNRKGKDKVREELAGVVTPQNHQEAQAINDKKDFIVDEQSLTEKPDIHENASDASDSADGMTEAVQPDSEDRDASPVNWDTDTLEVHPPTEASNNGGSELLSVPNGTYDKRSTTAMDDSSSTCSTDSLPSYGPYKEDSNLNCQRENFPNRGKNHQGKTACDVRCTVINSQASELASNASDISDMNGGTKGLEGEFEVVVNALHERVTHLEHCVGQIKDEDVSLQKKVKTKDLSDVERTPEEKTAVAAPSLNRSPPKSPRKSLNSTSPLKPVINSSDTVDSVQLKKASSNLPQQTDKAVTSVISLNAGIPKFESQPARTDKKPLPVMSRSSSVSMEPGPRPTAPVVSVVHASPLLARSTTAAGQMVSDPQAATLSYVPQSYRNAIVGNSVASSASRFAYTSSPSLGANPSPVNIKSPSLVSSPLFLTPSSERVNLNSGQSGFAFNPVSQDALQSGPHWMENSQRDAGRSTRAEPSLINAIQNLELYPPSRSVALGHFPSEFSAATSGRQSQFGAAEEFPHLDIINDLLDDEYGMGISAAACPPFGSLSNGLHHLNRQYSFPLDVGVSSDLPSTSGSSGRLERMRSYHEGFQQGYVSSATQFDAGREFIPQSSPLPYPSGHVDGMIQNQWNMSSPDLSFSGLRNVDDGSQYYPEYSNLASAIKRYTASRPPNGH